jgi:hypothetical protein
MLDGFHRAGAQSLLVSGGFTYFTDRLKRRAGLGHTLSNVLEIRDGRLTGRIEGEIVDAAAKAGALRALRAELGAGTAVATIRWITERLARTPGSTLIRVNPREADIRAPHVSIAAGALEAIRGIDRAIHTG